MKNNQDRPAIARGKTADREAPRSLSIPTPEELGISSTKLVQVSEPKPLLDGTEELDFAQVEKKLDRAGVKGYQLEKRDGGYRFSCQLPEGTIVGKGNTKNEAIRNALIQLAY